MARKTIKIEGMKCQHCAKHVAKALEELSGVSGVEVHLDSHTASIEMSDTVSNESIKEAVSRAGYTVIEIS